jgi:hypothetical protein
MKRNNINSFLKMTGNKEKIIELVDDIFEASTRMKEYNERIKKGESPLSNQMKNAFDDLKAYAKKLEEHIQNY